MVNLVRTSLTELRPHYVEIAHSEDFELWKTELLSEKVVIVEGPVGYESEVIANPDAPRIEPPISIFEAFSLSNLYSDLRFLTFLPDLQCLQTLNLRGCVSMSKSDILDLILGCGKTVRVLNLSFIPSVDDEVLEFIGTYARENLRVLEVRYC
jgi:hypothetical protein